MNGNSDDIGKRIQERINRIFAEIRAKNHQQSLPGKPYPVKTQQTTNVNKVALKPEIAIFRDRRLNDTLVSLKALGYDEKNIMRFLNGLELNSSTSVNSIIKMGLGNL